MTLPSPDRDVKDDVIGKIAEAIWETWRTSGAAREEYRDLLWSELVAMAGRHPSGNVAERLVTLGKNEARVAVRALANNDAAYELLARQIAINEGDDPDTMTGWAAKYPIWHEHTSAVQAVLTALRAIAGPET